MADGDDNLSGGIQPMFDDPNLPKGWSREVIQRKSGRFDVYIISDTDQRFKCRSDLANYLKEKKMKRRIEEFDFSVMGKNYVPLRSSRRAAAKSPPRQPEPKGKKVPISKKDTKEKTAVSKVTAKVDSTPSRRGRGRPKQEEGKENGKAKEKIKQESGIKKEQKGGKSDKGTRTRKGGKSDVETKTRKGSKSDEETKTRKGGKSDEETKPRKGSKSDEETKPRKGGKSDEETTPQKGDKSDEETTPQKGGKSDEETTEPQPDAMSEEEEETESQEETEANEEIKDEPSDESLPPKRGRTKPKRYLTPEPEPAPRRAKLKAMFKDIEDGPPKPEEPVTPGRGRGRPKKSDPEPKDEGGKKTQAKSKGKTPAKKSKPKKFDKDSDDPDVAKNSQILAEIEAELAEINGTTSRKKVAKKRRTSAAKPQPTVEPEDKNRPALEGFEPEMPHKQQRTELKSLDIKEETADIKEEFITEELVEPPEFGEEFGPRRSARARRIDIPALLNPDPESGDEEEEEVVVKAKKPKPKPSPKPKVKSEKKKQKSTRKRRGSKPITDDDEGESIPIDSLEGAINSAASLLDDHSDSSGEQDTGHDSGPSKPAPPKQSRSGRNVRSPRRPMEGDFETDFSTLRRAMNATTSDFAARKRKIHIPTMNTPDMRYEQSYNPVAYDYFSSANSFRRVNETARTRTFEENKMEKTLSLMDPGLQLSGAQDREPLLLETHLRAAEPAAAFPTKRQRKSTSHTDARTPADKVFYRKHRPGVSKQSSAERSLLRNMRLDSGADSGDHMESILTPQSSRNVNRDSRELISEMTPPPTHPIIPSDDHNYSISSRYLGESAQNTQRDCESVETRVMSIDQHDLLNEISSHAGGSVTVTSVASALVSSSDGVTVPITSVSGVDSSTPPKEIVIYVGDKPTVVPVMQDESGMSVITLPNGIAEEEIQASLEAAAN